MALNITQPRVSNGEGHFGWESHGKYKHFLVELVEFAMRLWDSTTKHLRLGMIGRSGNSRTVPPFPQVYHYDIPKTETLVGGLEHFLFFHILGMS